MPAGDLLQWLGMSQKTGTLTVTADSIEKRLVFRDGRIVSTASNDPREYLGQFLVSWGFIDEEELRKAMEVQRESKILLGKILVMIGAVAEHDLLRLLRLKAEEEIYGIFMMPEGEFTFDDDELPRQQMVPLQLDVAGVVMEGLRRLDEWGRIRTVVREAGMIPVMLRTPDLQQFSEAQRGVIQAVNGHRSIEEIVLESRSSEFVVSRTIFELVSSEVARLDEPRVVVAPEPEPPLPSADPDEDEVVALTNRAQACLQDGDWEKALRMLRAAQSLDPGSAAVRSAVKGAETIIVGELKRDGLGDSKVPKLLRPIEEMAGFDFAPNEGFILTRINGIWDLGSIVKISPMREIDALLIFRKLKDRGLIEL